MDPVWEKLFSTREWGKYPAEDLIRTVMRSYKGQDLSQLKVLEMGCGAGANLSFFLNEGFQTFGVDGAPSAIESARKRLAGHNDDSRVLDLQIQDFTKLSFDNESFDIVVDYISICTNKWMGIKSAHDECFRVLKKGGHLYSRFWSVGCSGFDTGNIIEPGTSENPTTGPCADMGCSHFFSKEEIDELFSRYSSFSLRKTTMGEYGGTDEIVEWIVWAEK